MAQTINVNMTPNLFQPTLYWSQGDIGREVNINLVSNDGDTIPSGATVTMQATKPSGLGFTCVGTLADNVATFETTAVMTDEYGRYPAEVKVVSGSDTIFSANFIIISEKNPHPEGTTDGSSETIIPELTLLVQRIEAAADAVDADVITVTEAKTAAETAATNAATSENNAATSATNAQASETAAAQSATAASGSATSAAASAQVAQEAVDLSAYGFSVIDGAINLTYAE